MPRLISYATPAMWNALLMGLAFGLGLAWRALK